MYIELVDSLRCLEAHEETWLVAAVTRMDGRHIVEGKLGCPVCRREYAVRAGVGWFSARQPGATEPSLTTASGATDDAGIMRAGALLGLGEAGGIVVLGGAWTAFADPVAGLGAAHAIVLNVQASEASPQEVSSVVVDDRLPFRAGALRAVALDATLASTPLLASATSALRSRGRLVGPAAAPVPDGIAVLARDETDWVGERVAVASPPVALRSARR